MAVRGPAALRIRVELSKVPCPDARACGAKRRLSPAGGKQIAEFTRPQCGRIGVKARRSVALSSVPDTHSDARGGCEHGELGSPQLHAAIGEALLPFGCDVALAYRVRRNVTELIRAHPASAEWLERIGDSDRSDAVRP